MASRTPLFERLLQAPKVILAIAHAIDEVLETALTPREALVIRLRLGLWDGEPHTLKEIAAKYEVTRERVRQIEAGALKKLQRRERVKLPRDDE